MFVFRLNLLPLLGLLVQGYYWQNVQTPDGYHPDTLYFQANTGTYGSCGYIDSAVGRFLRDSNRCYIPFEGEEFEVVLPYDVLVAEPYSEFSIWVNDASVEEIREKGVIVCDNCVGGSDMYVCASQEWGPGKLIVTDSNGVTCYVSYEGDEHALSSGYLTLTSQLAADYVITDVTYYIDDLEVLSDDPNTLAELVVSNDSEQDQTVVRSIAYTIDTSSYWENTYGFAEGVSMSVTAGIPEFDDGESRDWGVSPDEKTYEYTYGGSWDNTTSASTAAELVVPAGHSCKVTIVAREMTVDVPYDATATIIYPDGNQITEYITGIYNGISVNSDEVNYEPCIPLD